MAATHPIRVYYHDTDAAGVVYHAAYVCFFERGRCEWLRQFGISQRDITAENGVLFAVKTLTINYKKPALLDDWLQVETAAEQSGGSRIMFTQRLLREDELLAQAEVEVVCVSNHPFRAVPIPPPLLAVIQRAL